MSNFTNEPAYSSSNFVRTIYVNLANPNKNRMDGSKFYLQMGKKDEMETEVSTLKNLYFTQYKKAVKNADGNWVEGEPFCFNKYELTNTTFGDSTKFEFFMTEQELHRPILFNFNLYSYKSLKLLNAFAVLAELKESTNITLQVNASQKGILYSDVNVYHDGNILYGKYSTDQLVKGGVYKNANKQDQKEKLAKVIDKLYDIVATYFNSSTVNEFVNSQSIDVEEQNGTTSYIDLDDTPPELRAKQVQTADIDW